MTEEPVPPLEGFDKLHDRTADTPPGEVAWGEWVYSHDRVARASLTRSTNDEQYLFVQGGGDPDYRGMYGTAREPTVMLWFEVASWSDRASDYDLMSPGEADALLLDDDENDDEEGPVERSSETPAAAWVPPDWVTYGGDRPEQMTRLAPDDVDGARRHQLLAHLVWRFSAEASKPGPMDEAALFSDLPWVRWAPNPMNETTTIHVRLSPGPFEVPEAP